VLVDRAAADREIGQTASVSRFRMPRVGFLSLRTKLIAVFAMIIFLSLGLAGSSFIYQMREYQQQVKLAQLIDMAMPLSGQVRLLEASEASRDQMTAFLSQQANDMNVRILLLDRQGHVIQDTVGALTGRDIRLEIQGSTRGGRPTLIGRHREEGRPPLYFVAAPTLRQPPPGTSDRFVARGESHIVAIAIPEHSLGESWLELAPSLGIAGLIALILSIGVALFFAGSIARPVSAMTRAAEEMARGKYDQSIQVRGNDEIARLAESFNTMAREVGHSQQLLRDFLADASHELRTPLTSIQGFSSAMIDGTLQDTSGYRTAGQVIHEQANRMRRLVDDLLYLSKLESGQVTMESSAFDLAALARAQPRRLEHQLQTRGIELRIDVPGDLRLVGDERRIEQVLTNLIDNALRFTPPGGTISVRGSTTPDEVSIRVHNTGSYIRPEDLPRIFERFYQGDDSRPRDGSGLGLAIVREIILAHGGTVEARSDRSSGTEFLVLVPRRRDVGPSSN
jgi:signal transduction histidine kinase